MESIIYDSWKDQHKSPFGAVSKGTIVRFSVNKKVNSIQKVLLVIKEDGDSDYQVLEMQETGETFQLDWTSADNFGLYFYFFAIDFHDGSTVFYGNNADQLGGQGNTYHDLEELVPYQLTVYKKDDIGPKWYRNGVIYHIFIDRFFNGNINGEILNPKSDSMLYTRDVKVPHYIKNEQGEIVRWDFYGGNLLGIIRKLPYLNELGITILYLSPIFEARSNHKYDTSDYYSIDSMFGDLDRFKELIEEANKLGMKIILDGVFNHTGWDSIYFNRFDRFDSLGAYQSQESPYYKWYKFETFPEEYDSWWGHSDLPTLDTENQEVKDFIYKSKKSVINYWTKLGIGGWRIDVADELTDEFLRGIRTSIDESSVDDSILIGEVWEDPTNKISYDKRRYYVYGDALSGVMNYPFKDLITGYLNGNKSAKNVSYKLMNLTENFPKYVLLNNMNNLGTHDTTRIKTLLGKDIQKVKLAFTMLFNLPGVPTVYYGDEIGLEGGEDPDNRRPYPWGEEPDLDMKDFVQDLNKSRLSNPLLVDGDLYLGYFENVLVIIRQLGENDYKILLVNPDNNAISINLSDIKLLGDIDRKILEDRTIKISGKGFIEIEK